MKLLQHVPWYTIEAVAAPTHRITEEHIEYLKKRVGETILAAVGSRGEYTLSGDRVMAIAKCIRSCAEDMEINHDHCGEGDFRKE